MEWKREIDGVLHLKHYFHKHVLALVDINQSEEKVAAYCQGCCQVVSGPCFSCANSDCNYHLHQKCAQLPYYIDNLRHPLHVEHLNSKSIWFTLRKRNDYMEYVCALCKEKSNLFCYVCGICGFCLDINCFFYFSNKVGENYFYLFKDEAHQLKFFLFKNPHNDNKLIKTVACSWCHEPLADSTYVSADLKYHLHKSCFDKLPSQIDHPCHRKHPLLLEFDNKNRFCKLCQKGDRDGDKQNYVFCYHCVACNFDIHLECMWPRPVIEDHKRFHIHHEHPFTLHWRQKSFTCDACGTDGNFASYVCCACHLQVHVKCASLPRTIKISRHDHPLSHKYSFINKKEHDIDCLVCFEQVKTEYGNYHCLKADCSYVAHVECATRDPSLYDVIEDENIVADEDMEDCSSFRVIERNKDGEATKIRHFLHDHDEHDLVLLDTHVHDNRCCDGCVVSLSISGSAEGSDPPFYYYSCLKCDFVLHKGCAELPKKKHHWYHRFLTTLQSAKYNAYFYCDLCDRRCTGFYYESLTNHGIGMRKCLRCVKTPDIIKSGQVHKHKVFFDHKCKGECNACGHNIGEYGAFRCKDCSSSSSSSFTLDFACLTLPPTAEHKIVCDQHLLQLVTTYNGTQEKGICEICETKRDPKHWYYHCAMCDTSAHPKCVLGQHPFMKTATLTWTVCENNHRLSFARKKIYEYPPQCSLCGKHCQDLFRQCAPCNYIVHFPRCPHP